MVQTTKAIVLNDIREYPAGGVAAENFRKCSIRRGPITRSQLAARQYEAISIVSHTNTRNPPNLPQTTSLHHRRHQNIPIYNKQSEQCSRDGMCNTNNQQQYSGNGEYQHLKKPLIPLNDPKQSWNPTRFSALTTSTDDERYSEHEFLENNSCAAISRIDDMFERSEVLGEGTYGIVYKATRRGTREVIALKKLRWEAQSEGIPATSVREVTLLRQLDHPNIVKLKSVIYESSEICRESPRLFLEFEYVEKDLRKYMKTFKDRRMPVETIRSVIYQLLLGLAFCHSRRVIHRDIKPNNVLLRVKRPGKRPASASIPRPSSQRRRTAATSIQESPPEESTEHSYSSAAAESHQRWGKCKTENTNLQLGSSEMSSSDRPVDSQLSEVVSSSLSSQSQLNPALDRVTKRMPQYSCNNRPSCIGGQFIDKGLDQFMSHQNEDPSKNKVELSRGRVIEDVSPKQTDTVEIKIADFGLARNIPFPPRHMTHEVVTLWYRAPEVLLGLNNYTSAIDIWSVGCVLVELLYGRPIFPGDLEIDTLFKIFQLLGTPDTSTWPDIEKLPYYQRVWPLWPRRPDRYDYFRDGLDEDCKHLIDRLLCCDHRYRITAAEALEHPWFKSIHKKT